MFCAIDSVLKTNPLTYKIKYLNGVRILGSFCKKKSVSSKLKKNGDVDKKYLKLVV